MVIENIEKPLFSMSGKMTQLLKALATHLENPDLIPSIHMADHKTSKTTVSWVPPT